MIAERIRKLRSRIARLDADGLLVTNFTNVTYLTRFTGDDSFLLVTADDVVILSDPRYTTQLAEECPELTAKIRQPGRSLLAATVAQIKKCKVSRLLVEGDSMTAAMFQKLQEAAPCRLELTAGLVEALREIKDAAEITALRSAIDQAERAFRVIRVGIRPSQTEREVAHLLEHQIRLFGGAGCSFPPIVAVGDRSALPHASPTSRAIGESPFLLIDWGACEGLYRSDLTRMLVRDKIPAKFAKVYSVVHRAQRAAIEAIRPGETMHNVDAVARGVIDDAGYGKRFGHGLGHGIGLDIHEGPRLGVNQSAELKAGMVVTVEPGIYLPGWGGIRIEDDVLVTRTGHEVLTSLGSDLADVLID